MLCLVAAAVCTRRLLLAGAPARADLLLVLVPGLGVAMTQAGVRGLRTDGARAGAHGAPLPQVFQSCCGRGRGTGRGPHLVGGPPLADAVGRPAVGPGALRGARAGRPEDVLALSLGDEGLQVAYWLDGPACLVDEAGAPVDRPAGDQAVTRIDRSGRQVAVVLHGRGPQEEGEELQRAIGSAARLAVDNERLRAEVLFRLEDLRAS